MIVQPQETHLAPTYDLTLVPETDVLGPIGPLAEWHVDGATLVSRATSAPWSMALWDQELPTDYGFAATVTIGRPASTAAVSPTDGQTRPCIVEGERYRYFAGEYAPGSDVALVLGYRASDDYYRLECSLAHQEVVLWHPRGGYLAVAPCDLVLGRPIRVTGHDDGGSLHIDVDDRPSFQHRVRQPVVSGVRQPASLGGAVYGATATFQLHAVEAVAEGMAGPVEERRPCFALRPWRDGLWIWDGDEPIACFSMDHGRDLGQPFLSHMKLRPGCRPQLYTRLSWSTYDLAGPMTLVGRIEDVAVAGQDSDCLELRYQATCFGGRLGATHSLRVSYDPANDVYRYSMDQTLTFPPHGDWHLDRLDNVPAHAERFSASSRDCVKIEIVDPYPYNSKEPSAAIAHPWLAAGHRWAVLRADDGGDYRLPVNHVLDFKGNDNHWLMHAREASYLLGPDTNVSPLFEFKNYGLPLSAGTCTWGYDYHFWTADLTWDWLLQGVELRAEYCLTGLPSDRADQRLAEARLHPSFAYPAQDRGEFSLVPDVYAFPVVGSPTTDFSDLRDMREPQAEQPWIGNYEVDRTVGRLRLGALRLVGPSRAVGHLPDYRMDCTAERYLLRVWVKTVGVTGTGPAIGVRDSSRADIGDWLVPGLTGDHDWRELTLVTSMPRGGLADICLQLDGDGTVWFADVEVHPLADDETTPATQPTLTPPPTTVPFLSLRCDEGHGLALLDGSGHRHSARLYGPSWRHDEVGSWVWFDGEHDIAAAWTDPVRPWLATEFTDADGLTLGGWIRPGQIAEPTHQTLLSFDASFALFLEGRGPYYLGLRLRLKEPRRHRREHRDLEIVTPAFVPIDQWTHVAASVSRESVSLSIGSKRVLTRPLAGWIRYYNSPNLITPAVYLGGTVFLDGILTPRQRHHYRGGLRDVRLYTRALTQPEIDAEWELAAHDREHVSASR